MDGLALDISHSLARAEVETSVRTGYGLQKNLAESILKNHKKGGIHSVECGSPASRLRCTKILKHSKLSKQSEVLSTMKVMKVMKAMNPQFVLCKVFFFSFGEHDETLGKDLRENEQCRGPIRPEEMLGLHHAPAESASTEAVRLYRASHPGVFFPFI